MNKTDYELYKGAWLYKGAPHEENKLTESDCKFLLKNGGYFVRNTYYFDTKQQTDFWYVIKDIFLGMDELSSKNRNRVRRALNTMTIERINLQKMIECSYPVYRKAFDRYNNESKPLSETKFIDMLKNTPPNTEFWGCFLKTNNQMTTFAINLLKGNTCVYASLKVDPSFLKYYYPFYGLIYVMNEYYLKEQGFRYVCDGARTISQHSNIQDFLIRNFNFRTAFCCLKVYYIWRLRVMVNVLYPFRKIIPIRKLRFLLRLEEMSRNSNIK